MLPTPVLANNSACTARAHPVWLEPHGPGRAQQHAQGVGGDTERNTSAAQAWRYMHMRGRVRLQKQPQAPPITHQELELLNSLIQSYTKYEHTLSFNESHHKTAMS